MARGEAMGGQGQRGVRRDGKCLFKRKERMRLGQRSGLRYDEMETPGSTKGAYNVEQLERYHFSLHKIEISSMRCLNSPCNSIRRLDIKR